ncbi:hypothetical protein DC081_08965 [Ignatzschineria cameli]|uniref:hypothetical protein n=1 Tax=Ignatzschineria cameli TaxID=2182793 RepID=UPI000D61124A|nr:hypothetical protein [Ignatzschineria cameli]PWD89570.1 hypothetical protein DC081_08965 [Ignatzschineria cameli]
MSRNLVTEYFHKKSSDLFHVMSRLKNAEVAIHSIDFDAKRINIERPTPEQALRLGWKVLFSTACKQPEAEMKGFKINWEATKKIVEIKTTRGVMA